MSSESRYDETARAKGRELAARLGTDNAFRQQVEADPNGALKAAGLPENATVDFLRETGVSGEVAGYRADDWCFWTCFVTGPR